LGRDYPRSFVARQREGLHYSHIRALGRARIEKNQWVTLRENAKTAANPLSQAKADGDPRLCRGGSRTSEYPVTRMTYGKQHGHHEAPPGRRGDLVAHEAGRSEIASPQRGFP
jgi:hypothetical protein